jgi:hypothetical protein
MLLTFSTSIVTKTRTEILHLADRVARELGSNIYQIVLGNPFSAIHCGMRFCSKIEDWLRSLALDFITTLTATEMGRIRGRVVRFELRMIPCAKNWGRSLVHEMSNYSGRRPEPRCGQTRHWHRPRLPQERARCGVRMNPRSMCHLFRRPRSALTPHSDFSAG